MNSNIFHIWSRPLFLLSPAHVKVVPEKEKRKNQDLSSSLYTTLHTEKNLLPQRYVHLLFLNSRDILTQIYVHFGFQWLGFNYSFFLFSFFFSQKKLIFTSFSLLLFFICSTFGFLFLNVLGLIVFFLIA